MRMEQGVRTGLGHGGITCVLQTQFSSLVFRWRSPVLNSQQFGDFLHHKPSRSNPLTMAQILVDFCGFAYLKVLVQYTVFDLISAHFPISAQYDNV